MTQPTDTNNPKPKKTTTEAEKLISFISKVLSDKKGEQIVQMDLRGVTTLADYFVVVSGLSDTHAKSLADEVTEQVREQFGEKPWRKEGLDSRRWIVLDYVNIVIHIFKEDTRDHYGLEKMWNDAKITTYAD
jgi:ribosome-associated protein